MILPDLNLLLHARNPHLPQHDGARQWWESVIHGDELMGLPLEVAFGFVRIATHPRAWDRPGWNSPKHAGLSNPG